MSLPGIKGVTKELLASVTAGLSGATRVGISTISSLSGATNVQQAIEQLSQRSGGPAKTDAIGALRASKEPTDPLAPVALIVEERGQANGVAPLDANGDVPEIHIPAVALGRPYEVASQAAMLALGGTETLPEPAGVGDVAIRSDLNKTFMLRAAPASTLSNWAELRTPTDAVLAVDGRTGAVSLSDLYAAASDARLRTIRDEGIAVTNRAILDFTGPGVIVSDDGAGGRTQVNISGAAAGAASRTAAGVTEYADATEAQDPARQDRAIDPAGLAAEITRRLGARRGHFPGTGPQVITGVTLAVDGESVTADVRGVGGIPADAVGVHVLLKTNNAGAARDLWIDSADAAKRVGPARHRSLSGLAYSNLSVGLGTGANAGKLRVSGESGVGSGGAVDAWVTGWWR